VLPFLYPPVFPYLFMELARLQVSTAQLVWSVGWKSQHSAAPRSWQWSGFGADRSWLGSCRFPGRWRCSLGLGLAMGLNLPCSVAMGQVNLFVLLLVLPILILPEDREHWASALMALAILIKVTPIFLLLVFLAARRYRSVGRSCLWMGVWVACSLVSRRVDLMDCVLQILARDILWSGPCRGSSAPAHCPTSPWRASFPPD